jgi:hypothetical protein
LLWFTGILILISGMALSPDLSFILLSFCIVMTAVVTVLGPKRHRIVGAILLVVSIAAWTGPARYVLER